MPEAQEALPSCANGCNALIGCTHLDLVRIEMGHNVLQRATLWQQGTHCTAASQSASEP